MGIVWFASIPGLSSLDARSTILSWDNRLFPNMAQWSPGWGWGTKLPQWRIDLRYPCTEDTHTMCVCSGTHVCVCPCGCSIMCTHHLKHREWEKPQKSARPGPSFSDEVTDPPGRALPKALGHGWWGQYQDLAYLSPPQSMESPPSSFHGWKEARGLCGD